MNHREQAEQWLAQDPDSETRAEVRALLDAGDDAGLAARFSAGLEFGTAGLRGPMGAGPARMNRVTVLRAAAGLAAWLRPGSTVVVGYDARHNSDVFARDTVEVLAGAGRRALLLPRPLPTPVLAHAVRARAADAGVMVTASHNPPQDNGYKVYVGGEGPWAGSQIAPPVDAEIAAAIAAVGRVDTLPRADDWQRLGEEVVADYLDAVTALPLGRDRDLDTVSTALHGVGGAVLRAAFARAGFRVPHPVAEQEEPDPDFPTVAFPNPEEPGAMELALAEGERRGADLVLANDPDADRLAVAVPGHGVLTGDEVGGLLAEYVLARTTGPDRLVATTVVSAGLLRAIAEAHGVRFAETLTGFKWLVRAGGAGARNVFCYEEALGYCVGGDGGRPVADKDGISAALAVAALAAEAKRDGRTLVDLLDDQARRYGLHLTRQRSQRVADPAVLGAAMRELRQRPPGAFGDFRVARAEDFAAGAQGLPPADVLRYHLTGPLRARVILRPSGTEPKLKTYLEVVAPVGGAVADARAAARTHLDALGDAVAAVLPHR